MQTKEQLIQKLFANQCSKKELNLLFELVQADKKETAPEVMMTLLQKIGKVPTLDSATSNRILNKVLNKTIEAKLTPKKQIIPLKSRKRSYWFRSAAAAILLLLIASWFVFQFVTPTDLIAQTDYGERKEIVLPDGSIVTLNGNSRIHYPSIWSKGATRIVKLQGEAFFKVEKKLSTNAKFQVITKDLTVEVLGTAFNVNTRQATTKVFLEEGKVKLNLEDEKSSELYLKPGEVMTYSAKKKLLIRPQKIADELQISWKRGILTFKDTPLKMILEKLAETNNFEFEIEGTELAERKFSLSLPNDNMELAMSLLRKTINREITKKGNKFIIQDLTEQDKKE